MKFGFALSTAKDKTLFTPGPLTTSLSVKQAMLRDAGSWHFEFNEIVADIREKLLEIAGVSKEIGFEAILLQGSGTFGVEAVVSSVIPPNGKLLVLANGAYGERIIQMASHLRIATRVLRSAENQTPDLDMLQSVLAGDSTITHVATVHCETTTGILNPVFEIGRIVKQHQRVYIVDAMSSFGAIPIDLVASGIDFLISSSNKCLEGVPGFSFILAQRSALLATEGFARSLSLDLLSQWKGFEKNGQFRYTPATHAILAFEQALREFELEGGVTGRAARYRNNHEVLMRGMKQLGFRSYLSPEVQSYIITSFFYPDDIEFHFGEFYRALSDKGMIIYPGKISQADTFRIGSIGRIFEADVRGLLWAVEDTLNELKARKSR
jgi:2-aminoethylphosphonate-pyruvate transaminase